MLTKSEMRRRNAQRDSSQDTQAHERDFHWIPVEEEVLRCEICGITKILER